MYCKSLWIKVSSKCIHVNVNVIFINDVMLFYTLHRKVVNNQVYSLKWDNENEYQSMHEDPPRLYGIIQKYLWTPHYLVRLIMSLHQTEGLPHMAEECVWRMGLSFPQLTRTKSQFFIFKNNKDIWGLNPCQLTDLCKPMSLNTTPGSIYLSLGHINKQLDKHTYMHSRTHSSRVCLF